MPTSALGQLRASMVVQDGTELQTSWTSYRDNWRNRSGRRRRKRAHDGGTRVTRWLRRRGSGDQDYSRPGLQKTRTSGDEDEAHHREQDDDEAHDGADDETGVVPRRGRRRHVVREPRGVLRRLLLRRRRGVLRLRRELHLA